MGPLKWNQNKNQFLFSPIFPMSCMMEMHTNKHLNRLNEANTRISIRLAFRWGDWRPSCDAVQWLSIASPTSRMSYTNKTSNIDAVKSIAYWHNDSLRIVIHNRYNLCLHMSRIRANDARYKRDGLWLFEYRNTKDTRNVMWNVNFEYHGFGQGLDFRGKRSGKAMNRYLYVDRSNSVSACVLTSSKWQCE